jgi:hypothetical protein
MLAGDANKTLLAARDRQAHLRHAPRVSRPGHVGRAELRRENRQHGRERRIVVSERGRLGGLHRPDDLRARRPGGPGARRHAVGRRLRSTSSAKGITTNAREPPRDRRPLPRLRRRARGPDGPHDCRAAPRPPHPRALAAAPVPLVPDARPVSIRHGRGHAELHLAGLLRPRRVERQAVAELHDRRPHRARRRPHALRPDPRRRHARRHADRAAELLQHRRPGRRARARSRPPA